MPSLRDLRRRIRSVRNTAKITKAMELVAASRLRRAQQRVLQARPYADAIRELLAEMASASTGAGAALHPLLAERPVKNVGIVLVTPDRGLAGALNANIIRRGTEVLLQQEQGDQKVQLITVGRRGQEFMLRRGRHLEGTFSGLIDQPKYDDIIPIARLVTDAFTAGTIDRALLVYPRFISTLVQRPDVVQLLPIAPPDVAKSSTETPREKLDYIYEPDPTSILEALLPRYVEVLLYQALVETTASFYSSQMVAMRNATDNAKELVDTFTLTYNKVRQANITREVTEIASAAEAMSASSR